MSRTERGSKAPGHEFWGKRPMSGYSGKWAKKACHRVERQQNKVTARLIEVEMSVYDRDAGFEDYLMDSEYRDMVSLQEYHEYLEEEWERDNPSFEYFDDLDYDPLPNYGSELAPYD